MHIETNKHDAFEVVLARVEAAHRAGVFNTTPIDATALLRQSNHMGSIGFVRTMKRVIPFAAAAILVVGVWGTMWSTQLGKIRGQKLALVNGAMENDCDGSFLKCFQGPRSTEVICRTYDYDRDGDVDLADFGTYQMDCDGPVAMR